MTDPWPRLCELVPTERDVRAWLLIQAGELAPDAIDLAVARVARCPERHEVDRTECHCGPAVCGLDHQVKPIARCFDCLNLLPPDQNT